MDRSIWYFHPHCRKYHLHGGGRVHNMATIQGFVYIDGKSLVGPDCFVSGRAIMNSILTGRTEVLGDAVVENSTLEDVRVGGKMTLTGVHVRNIDFTTWALPEDAVIDQNMLDTVLSNGQTAPATSTEELQCAGL